MEEKMKVLALDLGSKTGWAYVDEVGYETGWFKSETYAPWGATLISLLETYKPTMIVCSQTNNFGHWNTTRKMFMLFGVTCLLAERIGLPVVEFNDSSARKAMFNTGKLKKDEAHIRLHALIPETATKTLDEKDALILGLGFLKLQ